MGGGCWRPLSLPRPLTRSLGSVPTDPRPLLCPQLGRELAGWAPRPRFPSTLGAALSFWPRKILRARRVPPPQPGNPPFLQGAGTRGGGGIWTPSSGPWVSPRCWAVLDRSPVFVSVA